MSLVGNVVGAAICCVLGQMIGERVLSKRVDGSQLGRYRTLLEKRGLWVVLLLRLNPLTTSDLVSYAAGVAGVPAWKVAVGTLVGLGPWCYLQAYFAERVFDVVPGAVLILGGAVLTIILVGVLVVGRRRIGDSPSGTRYNRGAVPETPNCVSMAVCLHFRSRAPPPRALARRLAPRSGRGRSAAS